MISPLCDVSSKCEQQMNDLMMSIEAREQHRCSAVDINVVCLMTARKYQRFHTVDTVISHRTNNLIQIFSHDLPF